MTHEDVRATIYTIYKGTTKARRARREEANGQ